MEQILVVEDDKNIGRLIQLNLKLAGYESRLCTNGIEMQAVLEKQDFDLIILDVMLPGASGFELIHLRGKTPVIFVTARGELEDKLQGLSLGAEDYIVKPFDLDELGARIAAHLRREQRRQSNSAVRFFGELALDYSARTATINSQSIPLSKREFEIVELLSLNAGQVFDRERIYELVWGLDGDGNSDTIMEHIRKIRAKFAAHTLHNYIETVWGCGYRWNA